MKRTKSEFIRGHILLGLGNKEIAAIAKCSVDYVRAIRQRTDEDGEPRPSPADGRYNVAHYEQRRRASRRRNYERYHSDPDYRQYHLDYHRRRYTLDPAFRQKEIERSRATYQRRKAMDPLKEST